MQLPSDHLKWLNLAVDLAQENVHRGGRPFGAALVRDGRCVATGVNQIMALHDPTSHAEIEALRSAGILSGSADMSDTVLYASGQPCPMCLAAALMSGVSAIVYAYFNAQAAPYGFSSAAAYDALGVQIESAPLPVFRVDLTDRPASELYGLV